MATSNSYDFSVNAKELCTAALRVGAVIDPDETVSASDLSTTMQALNMLVKQWMIAPNVINRGFKVWQRQRQTIDTSSAGLAQSYALGPSQTIDMQLPVNILEVAMVDANGNRTVLNPMYVGEYEEIGRYTNQGEPTRYYYERGTSTGTLYFDSTPTDNTKDFIILYIRPLQDLDASTDDFEFPPEWYRALKFNLWLDVAGEFGKEPTPTQTGLAKQSLEVANSAFPENADYFFEPGRY